MAWYTLIDLVHNVDCSDPPIDAVIGDFVSPKSWSLSTSFTLVFPSLSIEINKVVVSSIPDYLVWHKSIFELLLVRRRMNLCVLIMLSKGGVNSFGLILFLFQCLFCFGVFYFAGYQLKMLWLDVVFCYLLVVVYVIMPLKHCCTLF